MGSAFGVVYRLYPFELGRFGEVLFWDPEIGETRSLPDESCIDGVEDGMAVEVGADAFGGGFVAELFA